MRLLYILGFLVLLAACESTSINSPSSLQVGNFDTCTTKITSQANNSIIHKGQFVANINEFNLAVAQAKPGDKIMLRNGIWSDCELLIDVNGHQKHNITITAETKGKVILSGQSWMRISGNYVHINGLVFKNGYSPNRYTIAFNKNSTTFASNSRVSEIVIDGYSNHENLNQTRDWIGLFGKNNRVDHSHFVNKKDHGVIINVSRPNGHGYVNNHLIDHNYFGVREYFGANGAETIRVGSWPESQKRSETIVEKNIFFRTGGEEEIISLKSGGNILRENVVIESFGEFVLRQGHGNLVERNVFLGGHVKGAGGVRLTSSNHVIRGNYFEGLGSKVGSLQSEKQGSFDGQSAIRLMNGVPNSPDHKHFQVNNAIIEYNTIVDSQVMTVGFANDMERTVAPAGIKFDHNVIINPQGSVPFEVKSDDSGVTSSRNVIFYTETVKDFHLPVGFSTTDGIINTTNYGLRYLNANSGESVGLVKDLIPVKSSEVGVDWYN